MAKKSTRKKMYKFKKGRRMEGNRSDLWAADNIYFQQWQCSTAR